MKINAVKLTLDFFLCIIHNMCTLLAGDTMEMEEQESRSKMEVLQEFERRKRVSVCSLIPDISGGLGFTVQAVVFDQIC